MYIYTLNKLLSVDRLRTIQEYFATAEWVNGHLSGGEVSNKRNEELTPTNRRYVEIVQLVESALRESMEFHTTAWPRYMTRPIISRYTQGMYYHEHTDFPVANFLPSRTSPAHRLLVPIGNNFVRTDLSITLYLSDPASYDGGELCFDGPAGSVKYKLDGGCAVVYPTGVPHSVSEVTRGVRYAGIFWTQSLFPNEPQRRAVHDAYQLYRLVEEQLPKSRAFEKAEINFHNLMRLFAQV